MSPSHSSRARPTVAVLAVLGLALGGAAGTASAEPSAGPVADPVAVPAAELRTNGAPVPELRWGPCPADSFFPSGSDPAAYECAVAEVPLSYRDPFGQTIEIGVGRLPATDQENKIGTIFYNPGGPGGPGRIPPELSPALHERFDIVGFDPRGIGSSTPLRCFATPEESAASFSRPFPITPAQEQEFIDESRAFTDACAERGGPLLDHMSTANAARDMDLLRAAVGDERISYYGISYGTHLGAAYVNLFPDRVRAVTLDAVLNPVEWTTGVAPEDASVPFSARLGSAGGARIALESFLAACADDERCAFREPGVDLLAKYDGLRTALRSGPVEIPGPAGPTQLDYQGLVSMTLGSLYSAGASTALADVLQQVADAVNGSTPTDPGPMRRLAEVAPGAYPSYLGFEQTLGVACTDSSNPADPYVWPRVAREQDETTAGFGSAWTYLSLPCATWPGVDADRYTGPWDRETANPVLLVGNSQGDPATPYDDAQSTADLLSDGRLLTLDTFGHGAAYLGLSSCVDSAVDTYFLTGERPAEGTVCKPDAGPFDPATEAAARGRDRALSPPALR